MKRAETIGKILIALGILNLFREVEGRGFVFGGYQDNTWSIIGISLFLLGGGVIVLFCSRKLFKNR